MKKYIHKWLYVVLLLASSLVSCQIGEFGTPDLPSESELYLSFTGDPMSQYNVPTRTSDAKTDDEKRINQLYIFFFDSKGNYLSGTYLIGYRGATGAIEAGGYIAPGQGSSLIKIDKSDGAFDDVSEAGKAMVYAVANVKTSLFRDLDGNGRPKILQDIIDGSNGTISTPQDALESISYTPESFFFTVLPETGMPMIGHKTIDLTGQTGDESDRIIDLTALMARIDVNIQLDSDVSEGHLPSMLLTRWTARNLPSKVSFAPTAEDGTTVLGENDKTEGGSESTQYIYNRQGEISLSFYMFENMQQPKEVPEYPVGIEEYQKQRYKPEWANENAAYVELESQYTTYNNATYTVNYKLYLGGDHTDNYEVIRNHQYKNNIIIKGLTAQDSENSEYSYDARVNIEDQGNKYYISMLRERNHDAHFCVTPMDVYFFDEQASPSMTVSFQNGTDMDNNGQPWIRMEKIPAKDMEDGTLPSGMTEDDHLIAERNFTAGHGKRRYFTTDLVTNTLAESGKTVTLESSRDRVYFYIDENLSDSQERTAVVQLEYFENGQSVSTRTLDITQTHFLPVTITETYKALETSPILGGSREKTIYMEVYEEYLDHYDPLDKFQTDQIYPGLEWGLLGEPISDVKGEYLFSGAWGVIDYYSNLACSHNWYQGLEYTNQIINDADHGIMNLNMTPRSAAEYCYNRNKRNADGIVNNGKWFLPGIRQMENSLRTYYSMFPEFHGNYYWSSAAGESDGGTSGQNTQRARATKIIVNADGSYDDYEQSGGAGDYYYEQYGDDGERKGGYALRSEVLRIRAFRNDLN